MVWQLLVWCGNYTGMVWQLLEDWYGVAILEDWYMDVVLEDWYIHLLEPMC